MTKNWTLKEVREAYRQNLKLYEEIFSPFLEKRKEDDDESIGTIKKDEPYGDFLNEKLKKVLPKAKAAADQSGNAVVWRRGESLDGLNEAMQQRIRRALDFGL